jgi:hypothetical protein
MFHPQLFTRVHATKPWGGVGDDIENLLLRLSGASTKSFVKFAAVQETADDDQTTNIDRDRKSRD